VDCLEFVQFSASRTLAVLVLVLVLVTVLVTVLVHAQTWAYSQSGPVHLPIFVSIETIRSANAFASS
jgi:hypothetical protein